MVFQKINEEIELCAGRGDIRAKVGTFLFSREFQVLCLYRLTQVVKTKPGSSLLLQPLKWMMGVISGCEISPKATIGPGLRLPHPSNVIIGEEAIVGSGVTLYQGVTLGRRPSSAGEREYPTIGDGVTIYANSSVLGGVTVGGGSIVGAHSLVMKSFPENSKLAGVPARLLGSQS